MLGSLEAIQPNHLHSQIAYQWVQGLLILNVNTCYLVCSSLHILYRRLLIY